MLINFGCKHTSLRRVQTRQHDAVAAEAHQGPAQALLHGVSCQYVCMQVLEERSGDLHRQLLLARSELKAAKEDLHIQELDKAHLQTQLAGSHAHLDQNLQIAGNYLMYTDSSCR